MLALALVIAAANPASDDRMLIYVDDVVVADKALAADANALTTALCAALSKEKRVDVLCAPDVKQILSFAATAAMVGTNSGSGGPGGAIQERLDKTRHVVSSTFKKDGGKYVLVVKAGPKAADAQAAALYSDKPVIALEERGDNQRAILDKVNSLGARINAALIAPVAAAATTAPPAPLDKPKKAATASGW
jgi:hypothetical protein